MATTNLMGDQEHDHAARLARFAIDATKAASVRISPPACEFLILRDARPSRVPLMPFHCPGQANCLLGNFVTIFDARPSKNPMNVPTPPPLPPPTHKQTHTHIGGAGGRGRPRPGLRQHPRRLPLGARRCAPPLVPAPSRLILLPSQRQVAWPVSLSYRSDHS